MQYYVLDTSYNWADEMDIDHYTVVDENTLNDYRKSLSNVPRDFEYSTYIGSNEEQTFTKDDIEYMLNTATRISESDMKVLQKYVSQCSEDPIADFFAAYFENKADEDDDNVEEDDDTNSDSDDNDSMGFDLRENGYTLPPDKADVEDDPVKVISAKSDEVVLTEGTILFNCYLFGEPWFVGTDSLVPWEVVKTKVGWYKSFKSTVHKDEKGWYVYPNDDSAREKCYKFGIDSNSRVVRVA